MRCRARQNRNAALPLHLGMSVIWRAFHVLRYSLRLSNMPVSIGPKPTSIPNGRPIDEGQRPPRRPPSDGEARWKGAEHKFRGPLQSQVSA